MKVLHLPDEIVFVERPVRVDEISWELLHRFFVENLDRILVKNIDRFPKIFSRFFVKVDRVRNDVVGRSVDDVGGGGGDVDAIRPGELVRQNSTPSNLGV